MSETSITHKPNRLNTQTLSSHKLNLAHVIVLLSLQLVSSYPTTAITSYDGVTQDGRPSFYRLDGTNGISASVAASSTTYTEYFIKMWVRSTQSLTNLGQTQETLFSLQNKVSCSINPVNKVSCNSTADPTGMQVDISDIEYYQWIHVALSGSRTLNTTYLKIDYPDQNYKLLSRNYMKVSFTSTSFITYLGINSKQSQGFIGDIREFLFSNYYVASSSVDAIRNQIMLYDTRYLAYYRFNGGSLNEAQSNLTATFINTSATLPQILWDNLPNDMCYPYVDFAELPYLSLVNNTKKLKLYSDKIDQRYSAKEYSYQYSFSVWIKSNGGSTTTSSPYDGNTNYYIFRLGGVFALWYPDPNHIGVYFYSATNYQDNFTDPISFPPYQWANFQMIIDQSRGYEIRIYNLNKQLISTTKASWYMPQQQPSGVFNFNNFNGYIKSIIIYQSNISFPIVMPGSAMQTITNSSIILYYQFDRGNYNKNYLQALNYDTNYGLGDPLLFANTPSFDQVMWEESTSYNNPSLYGTMLQNSSFFDGIACNDQNYTLYLGSNSSYIQYNSNLFLSNTSALTVEFWFKINYTLTSKTYFFTIAQNSTNKEYFSIYQDSDNKIKCVPFSYSLDNSPPKNISVVNANYSYTGWQHIACKFQTQSQIALQYDNIDGAQYFYALDIINQNYSIPGGIYSIIIGNNPSYKYGSISTFYKEVRVWSQMISTEQIIKFLYQKVDPAYYSQLANYFQMASGNTYVYDFNNSDPSSYAQRSGILTQAENTQLICPLYAYNHQYTDNGCSKSPFVNQKIHFFAEPLSVAPYVQYHLTSQFSEQVNDQTKSDFTYYWQVLDSGVQSNYISSQASNQDIYIPKNGVTDNSAYLVQVETSNDRFTFNDLNEATITPVSCRYVGDSTTKRQINEIILTAPPGSQDINIYFSVFNVQNADCSTATKFNTIQTTVDLFYEPSSFSPLYVTQNFIAINNTFHINIPADYQYMIPMEKYVNLVATVYWTDSLANVVYYNIVYRIMFAYQISAVATVQFTNILVNQDLLIYGGNSSVSNLTSSLQDKAGLSYSWQCVNTFNTPCSNYYNERFLKISFGDFLVSNGAYDQGYQFQLATWRANNYDSYANSTTSMTIYWRDVQIPDFSIVINGNSVLASQDNTFYIELNNYVSDDPNLFISWFFYPTLNNQSDNLQFSQDNTVIKVLEGGFSFSTNYTLQLSILNKLYPTESVITQSLNFSIGKPPQNGSVSATPKNGSFLQTVFYFSISSWQSNYQPVKYRVYGIKDSTTDPILLTSTWQTQGKAYNSTLPSLSSVIFEITDARLETVMVGATINVVLNSSTSFSSIIANLSSSSNIATKYQDYGYVIDELQSTTMSTSDIIQYQTAIINNIVSDLSYINYYNTSNASLGLITAANAIIPNLLSNQSNINSTIALQANIALQQISVSPTLFAAALSSSDFQQDYAESLSLLLDYASTGISSNGRRMLQSSSMNPLTMSLLVQKQNYTDTLCSILSTYQTKQSIKTGAFETVIEKIPLNSTTLTTSLGSSDGLYQMVVPVSDLIAKTNSYYNSNLTDICIQASFYSMNLFQGMTFTNQSQNVDQYLQIETRDNLGNHIIDYGGINNLKNQFDPTFAYNFNNSSLNFSTNQTVCEYINTTLISYTTATAWTTGTCQTNYLTSQNNIQCMCSSMGPYFYAIINDYNRLVPQILNNSQNQSSSPNQTTNVIATIKFNYEVLALIIVLAFINICLPIVAILQDKRDYNSLKMDIYDVNDDFLKKIALKKQLPLEKLLYQKKQIASFKGLSQIGFCSIFFLFLKQLHPLFSIVFKFDVEIKRLVRYMILLYQICIIAIISTAIFTNIQGFGGKIDTDNGDNAHYALEIGAILSILTLPLPNCLLSCIRTRLVLESDIEKKNQSKSQSKAPVQNETVINHDVTTTQIKKQILLDFTNLINYSQELKKENQNDASPEDPEGMPQTQQRLQSSEDDVNTRHKQKKSISTTNDLFDFASIEDPVTAIDNCIPLKIMLITISQGLCIGTIVYVAYSSAHVTKLQSRSIVICWFMAVFGGWIVLNFLRIVLVALFALPVVKNQTSNEGQVSGAAVIFDCLIVPEEAKELLQDMFLVSSLQQEGGTGEQNEPQSKLEEGDQLNKDDDKQDDTERKEAQPSQQMAQSQKRNILPKAPAYKIGDDEASQNGSRNERQQARKAARQNRLKDESQVKGSSDEKNKI